MPKATGIKNPDRKNFSASKGIIKSEKTEDSRTFCNRAATRAGDRSEKNCGDNQECKKS
jgi:hypothetical protein